MFKVSGFHLTHPRLPHSTGGRTGHPSGCEPSVSGIFPVAHCSRASKAMGALMEFRTDQYLLFKPSGRDSRYLNTQTFQEEVLEHPGDRFERPGQNPLFYSEKMLRIGGREGPLFSVLPSN